MRILTIGVGGAGSRIVDQLYYQDQRSSISCMSAVVVDTDGNFLSQLRYLPDESKIFFPAIDPEVHFDVRSTVDLNEVMTQIKRMDNIDIDAIMIFTGLGGNLSDIIPDLTKEIRKSYFEPVFVVCTLPYLREGRRQAAKAADDLEKIEESVDGIFLFDNETWYRKIKASFEVTIDEAGNPVSTPSPYGKTFPENPRDMYRMLNEKISRQIGLLLRAGEFNEDGFDSAEVVLDAGEILNTLKGNGITAVGYAVEPLPTNWTDIFDKWLPEKQLNNFSEESQKRATRIVALAKKAVYEDISVPCDLTSAEKALILIAGPSRELSMKGFQTVRKWIDTSIAGLEMRAGDYPVTNTKFVGIIIMLSGIHNIPRLEEIKRLRDDFLREQDEKKAMGEDQSLLEEEMLLLSGMGSSQNDSGFIPADEPAEAVRRVQNYEPGRAQPPQNYYAPAYDPYSRNDEALEQEALEFIGGYSSKPPRAEAKRNLNVAPIIEVGDDRYMDSEYSEDSEGSLDLKDFLEDEPEEEPQTHELANDPRFIEYKKQYSFSALLEDDSEPESSVDPFDSGWMDEEKTPVRRRPEPEDIPLTSREYVMEQEFQEYSAEKRENDSLKPAVKDDQISISGKKEKKVDNNGIILPGRSERNVSDMTRMTSVNMGNAPKDTIFGAGARIKGPMMPKEKSDVAMVGEKISIGRNSFHATDKTLSAGNFSAGSKMRPKDNVFGGGSVSAGKAIHPNDSTFTGSGVSVGKNMSVNDSTFSGGKVNMKPNILPKDSDRISVKGKVKKPKELLSDNIGMRQGGGVKGPKELLSDNIRMRKGSGSSPKELLSDNIRMRGGAAAKPKDDIFAKSVTGKGSPGHSKGSPGKSSFSGTGDFTPAPGQKKNAKKGSDSKDEDLFWA
ncbi:Tubulin/FtsZ GTPase [Methanolacinia petrolearia DSM 11571]|uniref:Tubulin/FtsZ GTPase n=1 Tax=Methanolacinia petrolearia (strain DSM 11571 / OCM 486 / SEBR 4847) TaxID=679926 RepID=E1RKB4_METP4|nr:tubulin/FtsZ family protein [Methanolacinia petrolearia]ADN36927.1 Tubulin/FtsZ GTPase [Methanolacinia petrolearia DSM 11571]